ncbi:hypothetical protein NDU88_002488 [Pleurodeles waltl]|uniref:Uncharacterized protein n=1 Tax=Pleurodeles waltl TaxID=8319 RepID=A0AAV7NGI9_PLEWA|nr:hypothetical protein NDU88_002486 [Pleurodeles waltl]KAJ1114249.1 hypothetical protein NDU88_002488 [Pleurodeles waltl]
MPGSRSSHKISGKPARQLLFPEALLQAKGSHPLWRHCHLRHTTIWRTQPRNPPWIVSSRKLRQLAVGFPENIEGEDLHGFLRDTLPRLSGITFDPPLEFQRAHRLGPRSPGTDARPRPIIACLLGHAQASQLIQKARTQGPCQLEGHTILISADFSKETSERQRAFLALRPRLCQMEVKYSLFDPAQMWIMKNVASKDFYDPEDLRSFLDGLSLMDSSTLTPH